VTQRRDRVRSLLRWLPALTIMVVIFALSSQSGLRISDDPGVDRPARTLAHLLSYGALGAALLFATSGGSRPSLRTVLLAFALAVAYGLSDEVHQAFVPDRTGQFRDLVVDAIGAALGVAGATLVLRRMPRGSLAE
jgi:VanZ family protein